MHDTAKSLDEASSHGQTDTDKYLVCFREISNVLGCFGMVFGFVTKDINAKIEILQELREKNGKSPRARTRAHTPSCVY